MVTSSSDPPSSPPSDPMPSPLPPPPSSDGHDLLPNFSFPIMKPRSKRKPLKFSEPDKAEGFEIGTVSERPWNLRSIGLGRKQRTRFSLPLSSEEIEEDIYAVTGSRPRRRPKKRPRQVQKQIDMVFPGLWLSEVTTELYRVPDER